MRDPVTKIQSRLPLAATLLMALAIGCTTPTEMPPTAPAAAPSVSAATTPAAKTPAAPAVTPTQKPVGTPAADGAPKSSPAAAAPTASGVVFRPGSWSDLPGWRDDPVSEAWSAFVASCAALANRDGWREACGAAARTPNASPDATRRFFERYFKPWQVLGGDGAADGLVTGYYEPLLRGSRKPTSRYRYPLYGVPDDLLVIDLGDAYPEMKGTLLRGRLEGRRVMPYYDRSQIESAPPALRGKELVWVDDAIDLFFLQIQGSGRILLESGETIRVGYAEHNGYPYRSIGRVLVDRGDLTLDQASMQGIKAWARERPNELSALLNSNARYVFFREISAAGAGPPGSLGVALTPRRSVAVDARYVPLGAPVFLSTTWPNSTRPLNRLALAQDTGGAIRGAVRADFFWGYGEAAAREAGRMKQRLRMWVLLPNGYPVQNAAN